MDVPHFVVKLRGYFGWWRSGRQEQVLGARNCLVITTTKSEERAHNLLEAAKSVSQRGLRMFVFASEKEYLPTNSRQILEPIWRTPEDDALHSLLE